MNANDNDNDETGCCNVYDVLCYVQRT